MHKSLSQFRKIIEYTAAHTKSVYMNIFPTGVWIPLSAELIEQLGIGKRATGFHYCGIEAFEHLITIQNTKKAVSATSTFTNRMLTTGVASGAGIAVKLHGTKILHLHDDVSTRPDDTGQRWVNWGTLTSRLEERGEDVRPFRKLHQEIIEIRKQIMTQHGVTVSQDPMQWGFFGDGLDKDQQQVVIDEYISALTKILVDNAKIVNRAFTAGERIGTVAYDEMILQNFQIMSVVINKSLEDEFISRGWTKKFHVTF